MPLAALSPGKQHRLLDASAQWRKPPQQTLPHGSEGKPSVLVQTMAETVLITPSEMTTIADFKKNISN